MSQVRYKYYPDTPDATCLQCPQCWAYGHETDACRAFTMSQSDEEYEHRKSGYMACELKQNPNAARGD